MRRGLRVKRRPLTHSLTHTRPLSFFVPVRAIHIIQTVNTNNNTHSLIYPCHTHSLTYLLTHPFTHLLTHSPTHLLAHSLTYPPTPSLPHSSHERLDRERAAVPGPGRAPRVRRRVGALAGQRGVAAAGPAHPARRGPAPAPGLPLPPARASPLLLLLIPLHLLPRSSADRAAQW